MEVLLNAINEFVTNNSGLVLLGTVTVLEISPIKINPWKWIGNLIFGDVNKSLNELKKDFEDNKADTMRWNILNFARSCRSGEEHSEEEWNHAIAQLKKYETLCEERHIENGVIEENAVFLRELYHKRLHKNDFT